MGVVTYRDIAATVKTLGHCSTSHGVTMSRQKAPIKPNNLLCLFLS